MDILINNAGILGSFTQAGSNTPQEVLKEMFETNFFGLIQVMQVFLELLHKSDSPRINNNSYGLGSSTLHSNPSQIPTIAYVEAVRDCEVLVRSRKAMENLSQTIIIWDKIIHRVTEKGFAEKVSRISLMFPQDAKKRRCL